MQTRFRRTAGRSLEAQTFGKISLGTQKPTVLCKLHEKREALMFVESDECFVKLLRHLKRRLLFLIVEKIKLFCLTRIFIVLEFNSRKILF